MTGLEQFDSIRLEIWNDRGVRLGVRFESESNGDLDWPYSWSWYGAAEDFVRWLRREGGLVDLMYHATLTMDLAGLYRLEDTWRPDGRAPEIRGWRSFEFPHQLRERLAGAIELGALVALRSDGDERQRVDLTREIHAGARYYGRGKGAVRIEYSTPEIERSVAAWRKRCPKFGEQFDRIVTIARNATGCADETSTARIGYDWAGFSFAAGGLMGAIINHGTEEEPSWSIHT